MGGERDFLDVHGLAVEREQQRTAEGRGEVVLVSPGHHQFVHLGFAAQGGEVVAGERRVGEFRERSCNGDAGSR